MIVELSVRVIVVIQYGDRSTPYIWLHLSMHSVEDCKNGQSMIAMQNFPRTISS